MKYNYWIVILFDCFEGCSRNVYIKLDGATSDEYRLHAQEFDRFMYMACPNCGVLEKHECRGWWNVGKHHGNIIIGWEIFIDDIQDYTAEIIKGKKLKLEMEYDRKKDDLDAMKEFMNKIAEFKYEVKP